MTLGGIRAAKVPAAAYLDAHEASDDFETLEVAPPGAELPAPAERRVLGDTSLSIYRI